MDQLLKIIDLILNGVQNPVLSIIGTVCVLALAIFYKVVKNKMREDKATREREQDKERELRDLENRNADADGSVRDRLNNRGATSGEATTESN